MSWFITSQVSAAKSETPHQLHRGHPRGYSPDPAQGQWSELTGNGGACRTVCVTGVVLMVHGRVPWAGKDHLNDIDIERQDF